MKLNNIRYTDEDINNIDDYFSKEIEEYKEIEKSLNKEIDKLTAESTEWEERTYHWQDKAEKYQIVLDKIKEYIKEWREDDGSGSYGTFELLELLEEINE